MIKAMEDKLMWALSAKGSFLRTDGNFLFLTLV
jgi:hypothetical protein